MFRDFLNANKTMRSKVSVPNCKQVFTLSVQVLIYYLPFYFNSITLNQQRYSLEGVEEEEEFEMEFNSMVVQILSLLSTMMSLYPKQVLKDLKALTQPLLMTMFLYSLKSPYELEKVYREDQNSFLSEFLMETSVDYDSLVSIRSTLVDFVDEAF